MSLASLLGLQRPEENGAQNLSKKFSDLCFENQLWPKDPLDVDTIEALCNFNLQQRLEWIHEIKKDRSIQFRLFAFTFTALEQCVSYLDEESISLSSAELDAKQLTFLKLLKQTNWHILNSGTKEYLQMFNSKDIKDWTNSEHVMGSGNSNGCFFDGHVNDKLQNFLKKCMVLRMLKSLPKVVDFAFKCFRSLPSSLNSSEKRTVSPSDALERLSNFKIVVSELRRYILTQFVLVDNKDDILEEERKNSESFLSYLLMAVPNVIDTATDAELKTLSSSFWVDDIFNAISTLFGFYKSSTPTLEPRCFAAIRCLRAPTLDFRLKGANRLSELLVKVNKVKKTAIVSKILDSGVLNEVCGERLHIEVLKALKPVFSTIVHTKKWGQDLTLKLWLASLNRHSAEQNAIYDQLFIVAKAENEVAFDAFWTSKSTKLIRDLFKTKGDILLNNPTKKSALIHRSYLPRIRQLIYLIEATYLPVKFRDQQNPYFNNGPESSSIVERSSSSSSMSIIGNIGSDEIVSNTALKRDLFDLIPVSIIRYTFFLMSNQLPEPKVAEVIEPLLKNAPILNFERDPLDVNLRVDASTFTANLISTIRRKLDEFVLMKTSWILLSSQELRKIARGELSYIDKNEDRESLASNIQADGSSTNSVCYTSNDYIYQFDETFVSNTDATVFFEPLPGPAPRHSLGQGRLSASYRPAVIPYIGLDVHGAVPQSLLHLLDNLSNILCFQSLNVNEPSCACLDYSTLSSFLRLILSLFRSSSCPKLTVSPLPSCAQDLRLTTYSRSPLLSACAVEFLNRFVDISHRYSKMFQAGIYLEFYYQGSLHDTSNFLEVYNLPASKRPTEFHIFNVMSSLRLLSSVLEIPDEKFADKQAKHAKIYALLDSINSSAPWFLFTQHIQLSGASGSIKMPLEVSGTELVIKILKEFTESEGLFSNLSSSDRLPCLRAEPSRIPLIAALFAKFAIAEGLESFAVYDSSKLDQYVDSVFLMYDNETFEEYLYSNDNQNPSVWADKPNASNTILKCAPFSYFVASQMPQDCVMTCFEGTVLEALGENKEKSESLVSAHTSIALLTILRACFSSLSRKRVDVSSKQLLSLSSTAHVMHDVDGQDSLEIPKSLQYPASWSCEADPLYFPTLSLIASSIDESAMNDDTSDKSIKKEESKSIDDRLSIECIARWMNLFGLGNDSTIACDTEHLLAMRRSLLLFIADGINWTGPIDSSFAVVQNLLSDESNMVSADGFQFLSSYTSLPFEEQFLYSLDPLFVSDLWRILCKSLIDHARTLSCLDSFGLHALKTVFFARNSLPCLWKMPPQKDDNINCHPPLCYVRNYYYNNKDFPLESRIVVNDSGIMSLLGLNTFLCRVILYTNSELVWTSAAETLCGLVTSFSGFNARRSNVAKLSFLISKALELLLFIPSNGVVRSSKRPKVDISLDKRVQLSNILLTIDDVSAMTPSHRSECIRRLVFTQRRLVSEITDLAMSHTKDEALNDGAEFIELLRLCISHCEEFNTDLDNVVIKVMKIHLNNWQEIQCNLNDKIPLSTAISSLKDFTVRISTTDLVDDIRARIASKLRIDFSCLSTTYTTKKNKLRHESGIFIVPAFWNDFSGSESFPANDCFDKSGPGKRSSYVLGSSFLGYAGEVPLSLLPSAGIFGLSSPSNRRKNFLIADVNDSITLKPDRRGKNDLAQVSLIRNRATSIVLSRHPSSGAAFKPPFTGSPSPVQGSHVDISSWRQLLALVDSSLVNKALDGCKLPVSGAACGTNAGSSHILSNLAQPMNMWTNFTSSFKMMNMLLLKLSEPLQEGVSVVAVASESSRCEVWRLLTASSPSSPLVITHLAKDVTRPLESSSKIVWADILSSKRIDEKSIISNETFLPGIFNGATLASCYLLQCVILLLRPPYERSRDVTDVFSKNTEPGLFPSPFEFSSAFIKSGGLKAICSFLLQPPEGYRVDSLSYSSDSLRLHTTPSLVQILPLLLKTACMRILTCLLDPVEPFALDSSIDHEICNTPSQKAISLESDPESSILDVEMVPSVPQAVHVESTHVANRSSLSLDSKIVLSTSAAKSVLRNLSESEQENLISLLWGLIAGGDTSSERNSLTPTIGRKRIRQEGDAYSFEEDPLLPVSTEVDSMESVTPSFPFQCDKILLEREISSYIQAPLKVAGERLLRDGIRSLQILMERETPSSSTSSLLTCESQMPSFERCIGIQQINAVIRTFLYDSSAVGVPGQRAMLACLISLLNSSHTGGVDQEGLSLGVKVLQSSRKAIEELLYSTVDPSGQSATFTIPVITEDQRFFDYFQLLKSRSANIASGRLIPSFIVPSTSMLPRRLNCKSEREGIDLDQLSQLLIAAIDSVVKTTSIDKQLVRNELYYLLHLFVRAISAGSLLLKPISPPVKDLINSQSNLPDMSVDTKEEVDPNPIVVFPYSPPCPPLLSNIINSITLIADRSLDALLSPSLSDTTGDSSLDYSSSETTFSSLLSQVYGALFHHCLFRSERPLLLDLKPLQNETMFLSSPRSIGWRIARNLIRYVLSNRRGTTELSSAIAKDAFSIITSALHNEDSELSDETPDWTSFSSSCDGFVGLKNQGATCYQNSLLQQLFFIPAVRHSILSAPPLSKALLKQNLTASKEIHFENKLLQLRKQFQILFASMAFGNSSTSFDPINLVIACENVPVGFFPLDSNVRSQNDANEFFALLLDRLSKVFPNQLPQVAANLLQDASSQMQDVSSSVKLPFSEGDVISKIVGGKIVNQMIGRDASSGDAVSETSSTTTLCTHKKEREESFLYLQLDVSGNDTIEKSLTSYVQGELLTGDNAYQCDECGGRKVQTLKRCCIAQAPDTLVLQLKRFKMDWNTMVKEKINDKFVFGHSLDLFPYTATGIAQSEELSSKASTQTVMNTTGDDIDTSPKITEVNKSPPISPQDCQYVLRGVLIHSGNANSGHYFSYVKPRTSDVNPSEGSGLRAICAQYGNDVRRMPPHIISLLEKHRYALLKSVGSVDELTTDSLQSFINRFTSLDSATSALETSALYAAKKHARINVKGVRNQPVNENDTLSSGMIDRFENSTGWFEFNDERISPFNPSLANTELKWFGGSYIKDQRRIPLATNAFMLFYDRIIPSTPFTSVPYSIAQEINPQKTLLNQLLIPLPVLLPLDCVKKASVANQGILKSLLAKEAESRDFLCEILSESCKDYEQECQRFEAQKILTNVQPSNSNLVMTELQQQSVELLRSILATTSRATKRWSRNFQKVSDETNKIVSSLLLTYGLNIKNKSSEKLEFTESPVGFSKGKSTIGSTSIPSWPSETVDVSFITSGIEPSIVQVSKRIGMPGSVDGGSTDGIRISLLESCVKIICEPALDMWVSENGKIKLPGYTIGSIDKIDFSDKTVVSSDFEKWAKNILLDAPTPCDVSNSSHIFMKAFGNKNMKELRDFLKHLLTGVIHALCVVAEPLIAPKSIALMTIESFEVLDEFLPIPQLDLRMTMKRKQMIWNRELGSIDNIEISSIMNDDDLVSKYRSINKAQTSSSSTSTVSDDSLLHRQLRAISSLDLLARQLIPFITVVIAINDDECSADFFELLKEFVGSHPLSHFVLLRNHLLEWLLQVACHIDPESWNSQRRYRFDLLDDYADLSWCLGTRCVLLNSIDRNYLFERSNLAPPSPLNGLIGRMEDLKLLSKFQIDKSKHYNQQIHDPHTVAENNDVVILQDVYTPGCNLNIRSSCIQSHSKFMVDITAVISFLLRGIDLTDLTTDEGDGQAMPKFFPSGSPPPFELTSQESPFAIFPGSPLLKPPALFIVRKLLYQPELLGALISKDSVSIRELHFLSVAYQHLTFSKPQISTVICSTLGNIYQSNGILDFQVLSSSEDIMTIHDNTDIFNNLITDDQLARDGYGLIRLQALLFYVPDRRSIFDYRNVSKSRTKTLSSINDDFLFPQSSPKFMRASSNSREPHWFYKSEFEEATKNAPPPCTCLNVSVSALRLLISDGPNAWVQNDKIIDVDAIPHDFDVIPIEEDHFTTCHRFGMISVLLDCAFAATSNLDVFKANRKISIVRDIHIYLDQIVLHFNLFIKIRAKTPHLWSAALRLPTFIANIPTIADAICYIYDQFGSAIKTQGGSNIIENWKPLYTSVCNFDLTDDTIMPSLLSSYEQAEGFHPFNYRTGGGRKVSTVPKAPPASQTLIAQQSIRAQKAILASQAIKEASTALHHAQKSSGLRHNVGGQNDGTTLPTDADADADADEDADEDEDEEDESVNYSTLDEIFFHFFISSRPLHIFHKLYSSATNPIGFYFQDYHIFDFYDSFCSICGPSFQEKITLLLHQIEACDDDVYKIAKEFLDPLKNYYLCLTLEQVERVHTIHNAFINEALKISADKTNDIIMELSNGFQFLFSADHFSGKGLSAAISSNVHRFFHSDFPKKHLLSCISHLTKILAIELDCRRVSSEQLVNAVEQHIVDDDNEEPEEDNEEPEEDNEEPEEDNEEEENEEEEPVEDDDEIADEDIQEKYLPLLREEFGKDFDDVMGDINDKKHKSRHYVKYCNIFGDKKIAERILKLFFGDTDDEKNTAFLAFGQRDCEPFEEDNGSREDDRFSV